jgi:hypothetical protein
VTTADRFAAWLLAHPELWRHFCLVCDEAYASGRQHWSAYAATNVVRWTTRSDIDNRFQPYLARKYLAERPDRPQFFELRSSMADTAPSRQLSLC